jgi:uncharacterized membrane protein
MSVSASRDFEIGTAIRYGWRQLWANVGSLAVTGLVVLLVQVVTTALTRTSTGGARFLYSLLGALLAQAIALGWIRIALNIIDGHEPSLSDMFQRLDLFVPYLVAVIIYTAMLMVGFVLLVVPGIYVALTFGFYGYCLVDGELGPVDALRASSEVTRGVKLKLLGFWIVILLINILGLLMVVVGVLISMGVSLLAVGYVYRRLAGPTEPRPAARGAAPLS